MAQSEHLPIYKSAYDACLYFEQVVRNFSRYHKYSMGQDLRDGTRRVLRLIVRANARQDKAPVLLEIREEAGWRRAKLCGFAICAVWRALHEHPSCSSRGGIFMPDNRNSLLTRSS